MNDVIKPISAEHSKVIQEQLFELGFKWVSTGTQLENYGTEPINIRGRAMYNNSPSRQDVEITLDDLFKKDFFIKPIEVELNKDYTAEVYPDKIVVGCQTFSMETFEELRAAVDKIKA